MQIGQFKLDHVVEKNNECIIYRGSHEDNKVMIIQLNRQPLIKVDQYRIHFQAELNQLFQFTSKPSVIPEDFPFDIAESEQFESDIIEFPKVIEIHQTESHYYFVLSNCRGGQIINQQIDTPKAFLQIYTLYDYYYQGFVEKRLADRDFSIIRLFRSEDKITLIDFGFASLQKQQPKKSWTIKLGELFNCIAKNDLRTKVKNVINTLLIGRIKWEQVKELLNVSFNFNDLNQSIQESEQNGKFTRSNSIYSKQQTVTLTMIPQEIVLLDQNSFSKSTATKGSLKQQHTPTIKQSRIISYGNEKQQEHFQRIKQSLSPGFGNTNRLPCRLIPIEQASQQQSPQVRSVSRKSYHFQTHYRQPITKPLENQFEYKNKTTPRQFAENTQQENQQFEEEQAQIQQLIGYKPIAQPTQQNRIISLTTNQSQYEQSSYTPTIIQREQSNDEKSIKSHKSKRPQSSQPREQQKEMKTLLRKSTRELQQPDQKKRPPNQQFTASRTINYSETQSIYDNIEFKQIRRPSSRRNSIRKSSNGSVENIELTNDNMTSKYQEKNETQKFQLKTPIDFKQYSFQNSPEEFRKPQFPIMHQQHSMEVQDKQVSKIQNREARQISDQPFEQSQLKQIIQENSLTIHNNQDDEIQVEKYLENVNQVRQPHPQMPIQSENYLPQENKTEQLEVIEKKQESEPKVIFQKKAQSPGLRISNQEQQQFVIVETVDEYYKQPEKQQHSSKLPPTPKNKLKFKDQQQQRDYENNSTDQQVQKNESQPQQLIKLQRIEDTPKSAKRININDVKKEEFQIQEIKDQVDEKEFEIIAVLYENQLKKYDVIGKMVGGNVKYFQALKNFWIVPLFLCFKRMVSFRKLFEDGLNQKINLFGLDMKKVDQVERIAILYKKLASDNIIVLSELQSLYNQCQKTAQKFEAKELAKISKFLNMDLNQDIKDIYFVYLYTQVFKTLQNLKIKCASDPVKLKENLILQAGCLASLIISEMPFSNDKKYFDLKEYDDAVEQFQLENIEQYIQSKEEIVVTLKKRLNQKGIKI